MLRVELTNDLSVTLDTLERSSDTNDLDSALDGWAGSTLQYILHLRGAGNV